LTSAWDGWKEQVPRTGNALPVVNAPAVKNALQNEWLRLSDFITVADADADSMARFELKDDNAAAGSAFLWANGANQPQGISSLVVNASDLTNIWVRGGASVRSSISTAPPRSAAELRKLAIVRTMKPVAPPVADAPPVPVVPPRALLVGTSRGAPIPIL
jgi:hypothetical protein